MRTAKRIPHAPTHREKRGDAYAVLFREPKEGTFGTQLDAKRAGGPRTRQRQLHHRLRAGPTYAAAGRGAPPGRGPGRPSGPALPGQGRQTGEACRWADFSVRSDALAGFFAQLASLQAMERQNPSANLRAAINGWILSELPGLDKISLGPQEDREVKS